MRLRYGYIVTCTGVKKNAATGAVEEVRCQYDPSTRGGNAPDNRKVKATIHWVSAAHALSVEARLYDHLFLAEYPQAVPPDMDWKDTINTASLEAVQGARVERGCVMQPQGTGSSSRGLAISAWTLIRRTES